MPDFICAIPATRNHPPLGEWLGHGALNFPFDPSVSAADGPAIWRSDANASVVIVAGGARGLAAIRGTLAECKVIAQRENGAGRHLVVSDTRNRHRILFARELSPGIDGYVVPDDADLDVRVAALGEFHRSKEGAATKAHHPLLKPSAYKRYRLSILLAILDLLEDASPKQVTLKEVAKVLIYPGLKVGPRNRLENIIASPADTASRRRSASHGR